MPTCARYWQFGLLRTSPATIWFAQACGHPFSNVYLDLDGNDWKVVVLVVVYDDDTDGGMVIEEPFSRND